MGWFCDECEDDVPDEMKCPICGTKREPPRNRGLIGGLDSEAGVEGLDGSEVGGGGDG